MSGAEADATPVTIFGRTYQLRGSDDIEYLTDLAAMVDRTMREVHEATGTSDTLKVAILACLNIADEHLQAGRGRTSPRLSRGADAKVARMIEQLDEALAG